MKDNQDHETEDAVQPDEQSNLSDDELLCGECAPRVDPPRLGRTGEETVDDVDVENFECPRCGATGTVERDRETSLVTRYGCVTTPRLIDLERAAARERSHGGGC
jgi:ribosomal protein S27AE